MSMARARHQGRLLQAVGQRKETSQVTQRQWIISVTRGQSRKTVEGVGTVGEVVYL
jgi:uncharacterized protein affecting Mg2+/Co2+ transport